MSWTTAVSDVRVLISDGATDKLCYRKEVFGNVDASNVTYKTLESRRVTNFVTAAAPVGVYVAPSGGSYAIVTVSSDDLESGEFTLAAAPSAGSAVRATYYLQWFDDTEIQQFLTSASEWISGADDWTQITNALYPAAKHFAAAQAYQKLALKWAINIAQGFQLYDAPDGKRFDPVKTYQTMGDQMYKLAFELRDDVYQNRQGQAKAPLWGTVRGRTRDVPPNK